tara:strand:+ start:215 stop:460 length:246 start_codon:yes stop_codon:yes gene_type:complete
MVNWIRPKFLKSLKRFKEFYVQPIKAGEDKEASEFDLKLMRKRTHQLNKTLEDIVHRKDLTALKDCNLPVSPSGLLVFKWL